MDKESFINRLRNRKKTSPDPATTGPWGGPKTTSKPAPAPAPAAPADTDLTRRKNQYEARATELRKAKGLPPEIPTKMEPLVAQTAAYLNSPTGRKQFPGEKKEEPKLLTRREHIARRAGVSSDHPWMQSKGPGKEYSQSAGTLNPHHARTLAATKARESINPHIAGMRQQGITNPATYASRHNLQQTMQSLGLTDKAIQDTTKAFDAFAKKKGLQGDAYDQMVQKAIAQMQQRAKAGQLAHLMKPTKQVAGK